jgi:tetratricopeptide (TPR) repeat protein
VKPVRLALAAALLTAICAPAAIACDAPQATRLNVENMLQEAYMVDRTGDFKAAIEKFEKVTELWPTSRKAHFLLANSYYRDSQMAEARREMEIVWRLDASDRMGQDAKSWVKDNDDQAWGARVTTWVGGEPGFADGPVAKARLREPWGMVEAPDGAIYVADTGNHRIRKIAEGVVSTVAGAGGAGYWDGPAAKAKLEAPKALALDSAGNLFFCDGNRVRFLTPTGKVGTLAGANEAASKDGDWKTARLDHPHALAVDKHGVVYVAEGTKAPAIRTITPDGTVKLLAGGEAAGDADGKGAEAKFKAITALKLDEHGVLWLADSGAHHFRKLTMDGAVASQAACPKSGYLDGPAELAHFGTIMGLAAGPEGELYFSDLTNHAVRAITGKEKNVWTVAGGDEPGKHDGRGILAQFETPADLVLHEKWLFVLDTKAHAIRKVQLKP